MKTSLKIFLLAVALIVMNGCSAQRRAERLVRRAVDGDTTTVTNTWAEGAWDDRTTLTYKYL